MTKAELIKALELVPDDAVICRYGDEMDELVPVSRVVRGKACRRADGSLGYNNTPALPAVALEDVWVIDGYQNDHVTL